MRQILLNLLSNSIKFTGAGGQVIISTAQTDDHEVVLRVRDTGSGMSEKELQIALEPFRQVPTVTHWDAGGTRARPADHQGTCGSKSGVLPDNQPGR
jgi:signal transduction histidine kinase